MTNKGITKQSLDQLMVEYYYEKNSIEDTLYFLSFMWGQYEKLNKENNQKGIIMRVKVFNDFGTEIADVSEQEYEDLMKDGFIRPSDTVKFC